MRTVDIAGVAPVGIKNLGFQDAVEDLSGEEIFAGAAVGVPQMACIPAWTPIANRVGRGYG